MKDLATYLKLKLEFECSSLSMQILWSCHTLIVLSLLEKACCHLLSLGTALSMGGSRNKHKTAQITSFKMHSPDFEWKVWTQDIFLSLKVLGMELEIDKSTQWLYQQERQQEESIWHSEGAAGDARTTHLSAHHWGVALVHFMGVQSQDTATHEADMDDILGFWYLRSERASGKSLISLLIK